MDNATHTQKKDIANVTILNCTYADRHKEQELGEK